MTIILTEGPSVAASGEVVQANTSTGCAGIQLRGTFTDLGIDTVQARVMDDTHTSEIVGWRDLDAGRVSGQNWEGVFGAEVPLGSWYTWEIRGRTCRGTVVTTNTSLNNEFGVGFVFPLAGQSNIKDLIYDDLDYSTVVTSANAFSSVFGPNGKWVKLEDLDNHAFKISGGDWATATNRITKTGAFSAYTFSSGDQVYLWGTGVTEGLYTINSKVDNDTIELASSISATDLTGTVSSLQRENGSDKLLSDLQTSISSDYSGVDVPVGIIDAATDGSSMFARYEGTAVAPTGCWVEGLIDGGPSTTLGPAAWTNFVNQVTAATGSRMFVEAVLWQQGETDALLGQVTAPSVRRPQLGDYYQGLQIVRGQINRLLSTRGGDPVKLIPATLGPGTIPWLGLFSSAHVGAYEVVTQDIVQYGIENSVGVCPLMGIELKSDGVHFSKAAQADFAEQLAETALGVLGFEAAANHSTNGPTISFARFGDYVSTPNDPDSLNHVTVWVTHDQGTDLTLQTHSHAMFTVADQLGPLYVSAVTKGTTSNGQQPLLLTVERDTAQTKGADREYVAPNQLAGPVAVVTYAQNLMTARGDHAAAAVRRLIMDNATVSRPVLPASGWSYTGTERRDMPKSVNGTPLKDLYYGGWDTSLAVNSGLSFNIGRRVFICEVTSIANLASNRVTIEAPTAWTAWPDGDPGFNQVRPGARFIIEDNSPAGAFKAEGTVRRVYSYTDESTAVELEISDPLTSSGIATGDFLSFYPDPMTVCGTPAYHSGSFHFGG